jgi:chromosome partitioning protein
LQEITESFKSSLNKLKRELNSDFYHNNFDIVLIDCPPNLNIVSRNAIQAAHNILIPQKPEYVSAFGLNFLLKAIWDFENPAAERTVPTLLGMLPTMYKRVNNGKMAANSAFLAQMAEVRNPITDQPVHIFEKGIPHNANLFSRDPRINKPIVMREWGGMYDHIVQNVQESLNQLLPLI